MVGMAVTMVQYKIPSILPEIMQHFAMNATEASWLMSIFTLIGIFVSLPASGLARRLGPKKPMLIAALFVVTGSIIGLLAQASWVLILSRAIEGIALVIVTTTGPILIQRSVRPDRIGTAMGIWGLWGSLGSTAAGVITPTLLEQLGFTGVWLIYAAFMLLAAVILMVVVHLPATVTPKDKPLHLTTSHKNDFHTQTPPPSMDNHLPIHNQDDDLEGFSPTTPSSLPSSTPAPLPSPSQASALAFTPQRLHYRALITPNTLLFFVGFMAVQICLLAVLSFVPTRLFDQGFNATLAGFISTLPMLLAIISTPLFGVISDAIGRYKPLLVISLLTMGPCTFILYNNTGLLMWVAVCAMGLISMGVFGVLIAAVIKLLPGPEYVPMGMGVMLMMQSLGQFLGTALVQLLLGPQLTNWFFAGIVIMIISFIGTLAFIFVKIK
jgi:MFS family permease